MMNKAVAVVVASLAAGAACAQTYVQRPREAPEYTAYLSPACADISEAIRTGPARGVRGDVIAGLHKEYRQKCADDDASARQRAADERQRERDGKRSAQVAERQQQQQAKLTQEQCNEMLRILAGKRKQVDAMNDGERADLQRFETTYAERCKR